MSELTLTSANFDQEVLSSDIPVLVDFWATWCGPCQMMGPIVAELAQDMDGKAKVGKVNVDDEIYLANMYGVNAIPTLIVFKNGKVAQTFVGMRSKEVLANALRD